MDNTTTLTGRRATAIDFGRVAPSCDALAYYLRWGGPAEYLDDDTVAYLITELVRLRHERMDAGPGYGDVPNAVTVVTQRGDHDSIASIKTRCDRSELVFFARDTAERALGLAD